MKPLAPSELFPAGRTDITQRMLALSTGVRVRVVEGGAHTGQPVVLLPGWASPAYMFRHAFTELGRRGFRVIVSELRGFGLSSKPQARGSYTRDAYIADVDALLDALGLERALLVGQSMGGGVVMHFALERASRVERFVLINPTGLVRLPHLWAVRLPPVGLIKTLGERMVPRWAVRFILRYLVFATPSRVREQDIDEYWSPTQLPGHAFAARAALSEFDWNRVTASKAGSLAVPALVILGAGDRLVRNGEDDARRLRGALVRTLPGGHTVQEENPSPTYRAMADFLQTAGNK